MKNVISDKVLGLQPSGIRKFFDIEDMDLEPEELAVFSGA